MINLNISRNIFNAKFFPMLFDYSHRWEVYRGSAGSGKSHFIAQKLVLKALKDKRRVLVCRRYGVTLKQTVFALFEDTIKNLKLYDYCKINKSDFTITLPNESKFIFTGLDEETKLLSLQNISDIFIEEVYEVSKDIVEQLNLRLRGKAKQQQILMAFNPISSKHWLYDFCEINPPQSLYYSVSTYKDNRFLSDEYVKGLEELLIRNPRKAEVFVKGNWGALVDDLVYPNHRIEEFDIQELLRNEKYKIKVGIDNGFVDPTTIAVSLYNHEEKKLYVIGEFYKRGAKLDEVVKALEDLGLQKQKIIADSNDPRAIKFFQEHGYKVVGAKKGKDSVKTGISFLQNLEIIVSPQCKNAIAEFENYVYLRDRATGQLQEDKVDHEFSHFMDALRYSMEDIYKSGNISLMDKNILF